MACYLSCDGEMFFQLFIIYDTVVMKGLVKGTGDDEVVGIDGRFNSEV